ncbi:DUF4286 family protein [Phreatobacter stygius]|uniref:Uncharacterized protein n=1 Tax=Phreatobacter stygius TaxID=1940610 RepID=A0A4D7BBL4_9HYPH|nr:DUF4286 family protein [Phreatobacter stygius]QCI67488.1 hypothetical protein E8M01_26645 [Phreatobacter stygius]
MADQTNCPGLLFVWTDIDPLFEADFNKWYDREHVEERIAIRGFVVGTRYISSQAPRKYLGLYRTENLDVFKSADYRQAFEHQTAWSVTNFGRMRNAFRRVCAITAETGIGAGTWLAIIRLGRQATPVDLLTLADLGRTVSNIDGVIATRLLEPDPELSTPLPAEPAENRLLDPILLIEGTSEPAVSNASRLVTEQMGIPAAEIATMQMMWRLQSTEIRRQAA